jgi:hypothetical protein
MKQPIQLTRSMHRISDGLRCGSTGSERDSFWFTRCSLQSVSPVSPATVRRLLARPEAF